MAVGTVSGVNLDDQWQLITSVTASGSSVTFNSFSGYKTLWLTGRGITKSASDYVAVRPNNDSAAGSYATLYSSGVQTRFLTNGAASTAQAISFKIYNVDQAIPHSVDGANFDGNDYARGEAYVNPVVITSVVIDNLSGATFTGGTFTDGLFG
jgi:hypothetical protein